MTAPTRSRSRSRATTRRPVSRASGGPAPRVVVIGTAAVIALLVGGLAGTFFFRPAPPSASLSPAAAGSPAADVALPTEENPGPVRMDGLVPSGFTTGTTGAIAAASAYSQALIALTTRSDGQVRSDGRKLAAPGVAEAAISAPITSLRTTIGTRPDTTIRAVPMGSRVASGTPTRQTVDVWLAALTATPSGIPVNGGVINAPTEAVFLTISLTVVRTTSDWKFESARVASGPTPALAPNAPTSAEAFAGDLRSFNGYSYLPPTGATK